jgi:WD40 repeat protein
VVNFREPLSESAPHIYLSALPFSPSSSKISEHFLQCFPNTFSVLTGRDTDWPSISNILEGHTDSVLSVAFSSDGKYIVSGSRDNTICIWDAEKGNIVSGPFEGHTYSVWSVAFSPDGKYIVSGSDDNTICIWDAEKGNIVSGPFEGHTNSVVSVAFSPDGKYIVSGSRDNTICIWDAEKGNIVSGPFEGHTDYVNSVAFSPDGKYIVSGSLDNTIRIWDAEKGNIMSGPFEGHRYSVMSVAFSPDGNALDAQCPRTEGLLPSDGIHAASFGDSSKLIGGWMHGINSELLFWIPPYKQRGLLWPRNTVVIGAQATVLDLSRFVHGSTWEKCHF